MADENNSMLGTFPINTYVLLFSLFALVFGPDANLLNMYSMSYVVIFASSSVRLTSSINPKIA